VISGGSRSRLANNLLIRISVLREKGVSLSPANLADQRRLGTDRWWTNSRRSSHLPPRLRHTRLVVHRLPSATQILYARHQHEAHVADHLGMMNDRLLCRNGLDSRGPAGFGGFKSARIWARLNRANPPSSATSMRRPPHVNLYFGLVALLQTRLV
jgi:hypothetical protein